MCSSDSSMHTHDIVENILHRLHENLFIINLDIEFILNGIMDKDTSSNTEVTLLIIPVSLESDWNSIPSLWVDMSQSLTTALNDSLGQHMWLLVQMVVVLVWIVETSLGSHVDQTILHSNTSLHCLEAIRQHFPNLIINY